VETQTIIEVIGFIFTMGLTYGAFNSRLKNIEKQLHEQKNINERLARIEEQNKLLIEYFINKIN
jgi:uncharacterized protein YneF (UPF0154 family)